MGLTRKLQALLDLHPDVCAIQECSKESMDSYAQPGYRARWLAGGNQNKGLGVITANGWNIEEPTATEQRWVASVRIEGPLRVLLVVVWACRFGEHVEDTYVGQVYRALCANRHWFNGDPVVVMGDFNSNKIWDASRKLSNHSAVVSTLRSQGLISAYHTYFAEEQGSETRPTFYFWRRENRPFHIDYAFVPEQWRPHLTSVQVGNYSDWVKRRLSDHCPLIVDVDLRSAVATLPLAVA
jgi:endonuclease/exonuclease/phosphatase family metal-dependent hydrolase